MIKRERFVLSKRPYAVDLSTHQVSERGWYPHLGEDYAHHRIDAIWFRKKRGVVVAYSGGLWDGSTARTAEEFLIKHTDGRYGGSWRFAWDGSSLWSEERETFENQAAAHDLLSRALSNFFDGDLPEGYDGWWSFH